ARRLLAMLEQHGADAAPRVCGVDEESTDFRGIRGWIELYRIAPISRVAAEQRLAVAPSAARNDGVIRLHHAIRAVANELRIDADRAAQRAFHLFRRVLAAAELARRLRDERLQPIRIRERRSPNRVAHRDRAHLRFTNSSRIRTPRSG